MGIFKKDKPAPLQEIAPFVPEIQAVEGAVEETDERALAIQTVEVRDIKQYLVEEYERSRDLQCQIDILEAQLEAAEEVKQKYDAALVTLDAYKERIVSQERAIANEKEKTADFKEKMKRAQEEANNLKIKHHRAAMRRDEIEEEVTREVLKSVEAELVQTFKETTGSWSKTRAINAVQVVMKALRARSYQEVVKYEETEGTD